ncbi:MAG: cobyrinate a,c-diamide synthase [candidate division Zixibacteria bacterium]
MNSARLIIAGLSGDSGKTIVSLSTITAARLRGLTIAPFKKGPDYIDSAWLSNCAGIPCRNLDTWMVEPESVARSFGRYAQRYDLSIIEGNRGLFDGKDAKGSHSTAELARLLRAPLVLVVNATKTTRTLAALVKGCQVFDGSVNIAGVILNKVAGSRHEKIVREAIEEYCGLPTLGVIPKLGDDSKLIPGRHLGLIPPAEFMSRTEAAAKLSEIAEKNIDIDRLIEIAKSAPPLKIIEDDLPEAVEQDVRIGYFSDSVFTFYYPENLEALENHGAELIPISSLADSILPDIDGLYIGGGFPETQADKLCRNHSLMESVKSAVENNMPIYAECGGLIYLCRSIKWDGKTHLMAGIFPIDLEMKVKPVGHGYTEFKVEKPNPFFPVDKVVRGHEFHYSGVTSNGRNADSCLKLSRGVGLGNGRDGLLYRNCLACYTHIHAGGVPDWAGEFITRARDYSRNIKNCGGNSGTSRNRARCA